MTLAAGPASLVGPEWVDGVEKVGGEVRWDLAVGLMTSVGLIGISGLAHAGFGLDAHATN